MPAKYYFIGDMQIGGDGELRNCDFEDELIEFLKNLEREQDAELVIFRDLRETLKRYNLLRTE